MRRPPSPTLFPYTTLFRSQPRHPAVRRPAHGDPALGPTQQVRQPAAPSRQRSEEHTSELQSHHDLVCRLLLEKNKTEVLKRKRSEDELWRYKQQLEEQVLE